MEFKFYLLIIIVIEILQNVKSHCLHESNSKLNAIQQPLKQQQQQEQLEDINSIDLKQLFLKYSNNTNFMHKYQYENFLNEFFKSIIDDIKYIDTNTNNREQRNNKTLKVECLREKFKKFFNLTSSNLNNQTTTTNNKIDRLKFAKLNSYLIAIIDKCLNQYSFDYDQLNLNDADHLANCNSSSIRNFFNNIIKNFWLINKENWLYAFLSVTVVSFIGLCCVLIVPILNSCCYDNLFQFLVALALGTLCGDALLHLIPHAFKEHTHKKEDEFKFLEEFYSSNNSDSEKSGVYKGLGVLLGIYVFFLIEKFVQMRQITRKRKERELKKEAKKSRKNSSRNKQNKQEENELKQFNHQRSTAAASELSSSVSKADKPSNRTKRSDEKLTRVKPVQDYDIVSSYDNQSLVTEIPIYTESTPNKLIHPQLSYDSSVFYDSKDEIKQPKYDLNNHKNLQTNNKNDGVKLNLLDNVHSLSTTKSNKNESKYVIDEIKKSNSKNMNNSNSVKHHAKSHTHSHGHSHGGHKSQDGDLKSNAWMVILGDALHNFTDGLAIGASFASSVTAGFGTTIAVFCHELPHEIGDFAVLRRAGVSIKRAVLFNLLSSILCFVGVFVGLVIGGIEQLSNWSFLFIAGTFLYISLVDIIPELTETKEKNQIANFITQNLGILLGVGLLLMIALYEDQIQHIIG